MSLINDALKRAKQAQKKDPPASPQGPSLRPVEPARRKESDFGMLIPLALVVLVGAVGLIVWFAIRPGVPKLSVSNLASKNAAPKVVTAAEQENLIPTINTSTVVEASPAVSSATIASSESVVPQVLPNATTQAIAIVTTTVVSNGPPPLPKLQGVFYRPEKPAALVNGKTVYVGSTVGEYRVVNIGQHSVTIVRAGQTNVLEMPD